jgi:hypothetical protein
MQPEKACDHNDYDDYTDDVENIHCFAPICGMSRLGNQLD